MDEENYEQNHSKLRQAGSFIFEVVKVFVLAGITIGLIRYFLFKPFYVKGASMEPNFYDHEYLIVDELSYRLRAPERGEVIVFRPPSDTAEFYLKRIVGMPGERVKIENGKVTIYNSEHPEGTMVDESYLPSDLATAGDETVTLSSDQYFVLGDNRPNSFDSRRFGPISREAIVGRAYLRGWPINRFQLFDTPTFKNL